MSFNPEIKDDELFDAIVAATQGLAPHTIIEIGSANGLGSTQAFIRGIGNRLKECRLYCIESDPERFLELAEAVKTKAGVFPLLCSSVPEMIPFEEVEEFMSEHPDMSPARYGVDEVRRWYAEGEIQIEQAPIKNGIEFILKGYKKRAPLMALVDGSPFTGQAETRLLMDNDFDVIILDDTRDIKCYEAYNMLLTDKRYMLLAENRNLRNGYAIFRKCT